MTETKKDWRRISRREPVRVLRHFREFCDRIGGQIDEEQAGAKWLWPYVPAALREQAKLAAKGLAEVDEEFWVRFGAGLEAALAARAAIQRQTQAGG